MKNYIIYILSVCSLVACNNVNKETLKAEIIDELKSSSDIPIIKKGDGNNFYSEPICIGPGSTYNNGDSYIQHSTMRCPRIKNGVQRNCYKIDPYNNTFCNICMNDELITQWNDRFFPNGYKKEQ